MTGFGGCLAQSYETNVDNFYTFSVVPSMVNENERHTGVSLYVVSDSKCLVIN
jgi:hypothetical protein